MAGSAEAMTAARRERLAFAATWHQLRFEELRTLVRHAERLGYEAAYLDGDIGFVPSLGEADVLDGWTVQTALALATERIRLASIRLVHHWHAFRLAQAVATFERIAPGRQRVFVAVGGQAGDAAAGLPFPPHADRVAWLDETLSAARRLWTEPAVSAQGRFVNLRSARVRPRPPAPPWVEIGAAAEATLRVVARHADAWNLNRPAIPSEIARLDAAFARACDAVGRDPATVERTLWLFARPGDEAGDALADYRRFTPWHRAFPDAALRASFLTGGTDAARERLAGFRESLSLDLPVVDVTGLPLAAAQVALEALAPRHESRPGAS